MDSSQASQQPPRRLSALYQYHNAPEVAPAHGLEYDDTVYPTSDKFPVIRAGYDGSTYTGKRIFDGSDNHPPRIIFGMKVRTFLMVAAVMALVVVGAAVGGAVGGQSLRDGPAEDGTAPMFVSNATASPTSAAYSSTSTFVAATPTYTPLSDCPSSNNTGYTSSYSGMNNNDNAAGLKFTKFCDLASPLSTNNITEAFVYSFSDCIEVCAGYNFLHDSSNCTVAVYEPAGPRPANCWVGYAGAEVDSNSLVTDEKGIDVALLDL